MTTELFHFKHEEKEYTLPYMTNLKSGLKADLMEGLAEAESAPHLLYKAVFSVARLQNKATENAVRDMEDEEFTEFVKSWIKSTPGVSGK